MRRIRGRDLKSIACGVETVRRGLRNLLCLGSKCDESDFPDVWGRPT